MKECTRCEARKELSEFNKGSAFRDGYQRWCRQCFRNYNQVWESSHKRTRTKR